MRTNLGNAGIEQIALTQFETAAQVSVVAHGPLHYYSLLMYFSFFESVSVYFYISLEPILILCFEFDCIVVKFLCMQDKLTASAVGSIVGMKSDEIQQIASEYEEKVSQ